MTASLDQLIAAAAARIAAEREAAKRTFWHDRGMIRYRGVPWVGPHRARKATTCAWSGQPIAKGDSIYAPATHRAGRALRVLAAEWEPLLRLNISGNPGRNEED